MSAEETMNSATAAGATGENTGTPAVKDVHSYITSITTIKPDSLQQLKAVLARFGDPARVSPITAISTIHFARWVIIDNDTRLLFTTNFDGSWDSYINEFIEKASQGLDAIWSNCEGYPAGGAKDVEAFKQYVRNSEIQNTLVYSAYPDLTVKAIKRAVRTRKKFEDFLEEFQG
jgi:hypothetical protein